MKSMLQMNQDLNYIKQCLNNPSLAYKNEKILVNTDEESKHISIFISGSDDILDMIQDFRFKLVKFGKGKIHKGFRNAADNVFKAIESCTMLDKTYSFSLSGHSKGATSALICGMYLDNMGIKVREVSLYGCPKISKYKYKLPFKCYNVECSGDPVVKLPLSCRLFKQWIHLSKPITIGKDIEYKFKIMNHLLDHYITSTK